LAYQGYAGGVPLETLRALHAIAGEGLHPDLTLILDLPVDVGLARASTRGGDDRFERKGRDFHERLRRGFLEIAAADPGRCATIDASGDPAAIHELVWAEVERRLLHAAPR
jgi:dTMP kinase